MLANNTNVCGQCYGTGIVSVVPLYLIGRSMPGQPCNYCSAHNDKIRKEGSVVTVMTNKEKIANELSSIFKGDNENFSPEIVAEELESRMAMVKACVVIGISSQCAHNNSVVIGNNQKSDKPNQLKIGNNDISVSRDITDEEFQEILAIFKSVREFLPK